MKTIKQYYLVCLGWIFYLSISLLSVNSVLLSDEYFHFDNQGCYKSSVKMNNEDLYVRKYLGAIIRGDSSKKILSIVFTGDEYGDGSEKILNTLKSHKTKASFFLTGKFIRNTYFTKDIKRIISEGHYIGAHSDKHLLYCKWENRNDLLIDKKGFIKDLQNNYLELEKFGISKKNSIYFLPPYEWYNKIISDWTNELGLQLVNYTPGTLSHADYTIPGSQTRYYSSRNILESIYNYEKFNKCGLNGFILLMHIGTSPKRKDKLFNYLAELLTFFEDNNYSCVRLDELLQ